MIVDWLVYPNRNVWWSCYGRLKLILFYFLIPSSTSKLPWPNFELGHQESNGHHDWHDAYPIFNCCHEITERYTCKQGSIHNVGIDSAHTSNGIGLQKVLITRKVTRCRVHAPFPLWAPDPFSPNLEYWLIVINLTNNITTTDSYLLPTLVELWLIEQPTHWHTGIVNHTPINKCGQAIL